MYIIENKKHKVELQRGRHSHRYVYKSHYTFYLFIYKKTSFFFFGKQMRC